MYRRDLLAAVGAGATTLASAGCLDVVPGLGLDVEFETTDARLEADDPPAVTVDGDDVVVEGTVRHGSSSCGTVELAHAEYESSQDRLDLLVVAADDSTLPLSCTDDLVSAGYRVEATVRGGVRRVSVTEHDVFGETASRTVETTDW